MKAIKVVIREGYSFTRIVGEYLLEHGFAPENVELSDKWSKDDFSIIHDIDRWDPRLVRCVEQLGPRTGAHITLATGPFIIESDHEMCGGESIVSRDELAWQNPWETGADVIEYTREDEDRF